MCRNDERDTETRNWTEIWNGYETETRDKREKEILPVKNMSKSKDRKHIRHVTTDFRHLRMIF